MKINLNYFVVAYRNLTTKITALIKVDNILIQCLFLFIVTETIIALYKANGPFY